MATENDFFSALKPRFGGDDFALLPQVRNSTGFQNNVRTADALAVSLWPSRGIDVHGFEFKDSRSDWVKELREPAKAEEIARYCAYWWVVISDASIIKDGELPATWGLLVLHNDSVKTVKAAPKRESQEPNWLFVAAVLRSASKSISPEHQIQMRINAAVAKALDGEYKQRSEAVEKAEQRIHKQQGDLLKRIQDFERASGISLDVGGWKGGDKIGDAVRFVLDGGMKGQVENMKRIAERFTETALQLNFLVDKFKDKEAA